MASLVKRGKKWSVVYVDHTGKQKWKTAYSDKAESQRLANRLEDEAHKIKIGDVDPQEIARKAERNKAIADQIKAYKTHLEAAAKHVDYISYTIADIEAFVDFSKVTSAAAITKPMMSAWVVHLQVKGPHRDKPDANKTVNRRVGSVQSFLRHLLEIGGVSVYVLNKFPMLPTGEHHQKRFMRALTEMEVGKLLKIENVERRELYHFSLKSGLRMRECRLMKPECFDFEQMTIRVPSHVAKSKVDQTAYIHPDLLEMLKRRCSIAGPIFPTMPTKRHVINQIRADCVAMKVDKKHVSFHSLRHTFCTMLARANVHPSLLQKLARHRDIKTTLKFYVHLNQSDTAAALAKI